MPEPEIGSFDHLAGFIMSKLYHHGCWQKRSGEPRKHHSITNLKKGYPRSNLGDFKRTLKRLRGMGLITIFKHSGDGEDHVSAVFEKDTLEQGIKIANIWRVAVGLPAWSNEFDELV